MSAKALAALFSLVLFSLPGAVYAAPGGCSYRADWRPNPVGSVRAGARSRSKRDVEKRRGEHDSTHEAVLPRGRVSFARTLSTVRNVEIASCAECRDNLFPLYVPHTIITQKTGRVSTRSPIGFTQHPRPPPAFPNRSV